MLGSQARSAQIYLVLLAIAIGAYAWRRPSSRQLAAIAGAGLCLSAAVFAVAPAHDTRIIRTAKTLFSGWGTKTDTVAERVNVAATGRLLLLSEAAREFGESPIYGSGFAPYGRYREADSGVMNNSQSHLYYLTYFWKGGLLFGVPFSIFLGLAALALYRARPWRGLPDQVFASLAVVLVFGWLAFTWDIPTVPSAGALAFLLLGLLIRNAPEATNA